MGHLSGNCEQLMENDDPYSARDLENLADDVQRRQRWVRRPKRARDIVAQLMARTGYTQQQASGEVEQIWKVAVGDRLAAKTRTGTIRRRILEIHVENSATIQELTFRKRELVKVIQQRLPDAKVTDLRFRVGVIR